MFFRRRKVRIEFEQHTWTAAAAHGQHADLLAPDSAIDFATVDRQHLPTILDAVLPEPELPDS